MSLIMSSSGINNVKGKPPILKPASKKDWKAVSMEDDDASSEANGSQASSSNASTETLDLYPTLALMA